MAPNKGLLVLFATLLLLSLAHLTLASYSRESPDEEEVPKYKKVHGYGGKRFHKKKYISGYYDETPSSSYGDDSTPGYYSHDDGAKKPVYKKTYRHVKRHSYKKPQYVQYDGDVAKPIYKKPSKRAPYYKPKPIYSKPADRPKPAYTKPVYEKPIYTEDDTTPVYETPVEYTDPSEESSPETPVTAYEPEHTYVKPVEPTPIYDQPQPKKPETPAYSSPASSSEAEWLDPHNAARSEVGVPPLVWSDELAQYAENWASQRQAAGCGMEHSGGPYGENIFWGSGGGYGPAECVASWVSEKDSYNYGDNSCSNGDCGHYTQIIWANSARLGCAKAQCDDGSVFMTCNYDPPGNYIGTKPY